MPFEEWEARERLLKSCFCKEGHVRIPLSSGCYDPVRRVVTLKDPCFADYHCKDLPNTSCLFDNQVPAYNREGPNSLHFERILHKYVVTPGKRVKYVPKLLATEVSAASNFRSHFSVC